MNAVANDDWLSLEAPKRKRGRPKKAVTQPATEVAIQPGTKLDMEGKRGKAMVRSPFGKDRIWACDGRYVWFRPYHYVNGKKVLRANPASYERHQRFLAEGHYTHVETQDDVEVYELTPESPFYRKNELYLGTLSDADVRRQVAIAACRRDWVAYVDCLEELFGRIKNRGYDNDFASAVKDDYLTYIQQLISLRGGPTPQECAAGLQSVMRRRGQGTGRVILLPPGR